MAADMWGLSPVDCAKCGIQCFANLSSKKHWAIGAALPYPVGLRDHHLVFLDIIKSSGHGLQGDGARVLLPTACCPDELPCA